MLIKIIYIYIKNHTCYNSVVFQYLVCGVKVSYLILGENIFVSISFSKHEKKLISKCLDLHDPNLPSSLKKKRRQDKFWGTGASCLKLQKGYKNCIRSIVCKTKLGTEN